MKKLILSAVIVLFSCSSSDKNEIGKTYNINTQIMGTFTESDFDLMNEYASRKDVDNYQGMYLDGKAIILNKGDECKAVEIDILKIQCKCQTSEGEKTVWISSEFLD